VEALLVGRAVVVGTVEDELELGALPEMRSSVTV